MNVIAEKALKPRKPRGVYLEPDWIDSKAFTALNGTAVKVFIWFMRRRQMAKVGRKGKEQWIVTNNGEIVFTYDEAEKKFGLTRSRFNRAIDELIAKGFIDITHHGGGMMGDCTLYSISERWRFYGTDKFVYKTRPKDTRKLGFTEENWEKRTGKKRKLSSKPSNNFDTCSSNKNATLDGFPLNVTSNENDTEQNERKALILKAMCQYYTIMNSGNKNVTVL